MNIMWRAMSALLLATVVGGCGFAGVNPRSVGSAPGPAGHEVAAGDSIQSIAARYGTSVEALAANNGIGAPYQLTVGQRLVIPAPAQYVVQPGETLNDIARRYGTTPAELARINGIGAPYTVQPGRTLTMPQILSGGGIVAGGSPPTAVQVSALPAPGDSGLTGLAPTAGGLPPATGGVVPIGPGSSAPLPVGAASGGVATGDPIPLVAAQDVAGPTPTGVTQPITALQPPALDPSALSTSAVDPAATQPLPPASTGSVAAQSSGSGGLPVLSGSGFLRPVSGQVLTSFGQGTVPNDGVNIGAPSGTPILAAEAGVVAYVGEDIDTFGNLTLIRHADGWVTAYGHAEAILVAEGESVSRGQVIGRVGSSGAVSSPQLHFELRRGTEPVDPLAYLDG